MYDLVLSKLQELQSVYTELSTTDGDNLSVNLLLSHPVITHKFNTCNSFLLAVSDTSNTSSHSGYLVSCYRISLHTIIVVLALLWNSPLMLLATRYRGTCIYKLCVYYRIAYRQSTSTNMTILSG